jgi:hypothetical protein
MCNRCYTLHSCYLTPDVHTQVDVIAYTDYHDFTKSPSQIKTFNWCWAADADYPVNDGTDTASSVSSYLSRRWCWQISLLVSLHVVWCYFRALSKAKRGDRALAQNKLIPHSLAQGDGTPVRWITQLERQKKNLTKCSMLLAPGTFQKDPVPYPFSR